MTDVSHEAETPMLAEIWNRPARVDAVYDESAKVRWLDNGTLGFVPTRALGVDE
jgi:hypothetical protein